MNFKNIIFSENLNQDSNLKENQQYPNAIMQKKSKLLLNNKEVKSKIIILFKESNAEIAVSLENKKAKIVSVNLNVKNSNNEVKEAISRNEKGKV